jgi:hypothetical protein
MQPWVHLRARRFLTESGAADPRCHQPRPVEPDWWGARKSYLPGNDLMSYLSALRLHFAGGFVAAPSTVNNDITHYNNADFKPEYQLPQDPTNLNGWWNPTGDNRFTVDCRATAAGYQDGSNAAPGTDPVLTFAVKSINRPTAKIVDLDPQQQMVSMVFGMELSVGSATGGVPLLKGVFEPAPFTDIWQRGTTGGNDERAGAMYQSVLHSLTWGDVSGSRFLSELKAVASDGLLSIKFNLDGYSMDSADPGFTKGRLVGTIGPTTNSEPRHFVVGRHMAPRFNDAIPIPVPSIRPVQGINYCVAVVDEVQRKVRVDLGNAISTSPSAGDAANLGTLLLACNASSASPVVIDTIEYRAAGWYPKTAGIVDLPVDRTLTDVELAAVLSQPLAIVRTPATGPPVVAAVEHSTGVHLRADLCVARMNPGDRFDVEMRASKFGKPLAAAQINLSAGPAFPFDPATEPPTGTPPTAVAFPATVICDASGRATATLTASDPGSPRGYIDGQVYRVNYQLSGIDPLNRSDFLSLLVWDSFAPDEPPTWHGSMKPLFEQYANLYPAMDAFFDMADYEQVSQKRARVIALMSVPQTDARYMPVTRDLSEAKRTAMIRWLSHVGPDGKPLLGTAPSPGPPRNLFTAGGAAIGGKARVAERMFGGTAGTNTAGTDADQPA